MSINTKQHTKKEKKLELRKAQAHLNWMLDFTKAFNSATHEQVQMILKYQKKVDKLKS